MHPIKTTLVVGSINLAFLKSYNGFFNLAQGAAGTPFFFFADPNTYSMLSINIIVGCKTLAT